MNVNQNKARKLRSIVNKIPEAWKIKITQSNVYFSPVLSYQKINLQGSDKEFRKLKPDQIYKYLIADKIRLPAGILRWREDFELSDSDIKIAFSFARNCTSNVFNQVLQYKILTNILPTNKYLKQYRVQDSDLCSRCSLNPDTVLHSVWQCQSLVPYVSGILEYLRTQCNIQLEITAKVYIFGAQNKNRGLNCLLLELKKELFYNKSLNVGVATFREQFLKKIRNIIIKEKNIYINKGKYTDFFDKWSNFTSIYDFQGPDLQIV